MDSRIGPQCLRSLAGLVFVGLSGAGVLRTAGSEGSEEGPGTEEEVSETAFGFLPRVGREPSDAPARRWATLHVFQLYV